MEEAQSVSLESEAKSPGDKATSFLYERFFVHLTSRWGQEGPGPPETTWIESRTAPRTEDS